ncbi:hypothetical protein ACFX2A_035026 [Malus domestica]
MAVKGTATTTPSSSVCSVPTLFFAFTLLCALSLSLFFLSNPSPSSSPSPSCSSFISLNAPLSPQNSLKVYLADLPRSLNYGLLEKYWASGPDSRLQTDTDHQIPDSHLPKNLEFPPYPDNPLIKQYSAEYWILGDLMTPPEHGTGSFASRVFDADEADVVFVPFFATLSAELQLATAKGVFRKKAGNEDYERQRQVVDFVKNTEAWKRSGGRDHVFVLTDPVAMWHVRAEIAPAVLLVVDFGGWYTLESRSSNGNSSDVIQHTQVSLLKDVIVPYTHLLPRLQLTENKKRQTLLYFKGAKHRHRGGLVRETLWDLLVNEPDVIMEEGFPNTTGREQSIKGMRTSEFCLHPAGDTPTSCRLFDAMQIDDALKPNWIVSHLRTFTREQRDRFRRTMAQFQPMFEYDNGHPGGIGPIPPDGAVNHMWKKVHQKLPMIKESIVRERRKPPSVSVPRRCHCT